MRTEETRQRWIRKWMAKFDKWYFNGFFADKTIMLKENRRLKTTMAVAYPGRSLIEYNPLIFGSWCLEEIRDTILHEMLHMFLFAQRPYSEDWDDDSPVFREWSRKLRCPPRGMPLEKNSKRPLVFRICIDCDLVYTMGEKTPRIRACPDCGSLNTKFYRRTRKDLNRFKSIL